MDLEQVGALLRDLDPARPAPARRVGEDEHALAVELAALLYVAVILGPGVLEARDAGGQSVTAAEAQRLGSVGERYRRGASGVLTRLAKACTTTGAALLAARGQSRRAAIAGSGILLGSYSTSNTVTGNRAHGNGLPGVGPGAFDRGWDGEDDHVSPPCDNNLWRGNDLGTGNLPCVGAKSTQPPAASGQAAQQGAAPTATVRASVR